MEKEQVDRGIARWKKLWKSLVASQGLSCGSLSQLQEVAERSTKKFGVNNPSLEELTDGQLSILNKHFCTAEDEIYTRWAYVYDHVEFLASEVAATPADDEGNKSDEERYRLKNLLEMDESLPRAATFLALSRAYMADRRRQTFPPRSEAKDELVALTNRHELIVSSLDRVRQAWDFEVEHSSLPLQKYCSILGEAYQATLGEIIEAAQLTARRTVEEFDLKLEVNYRGAPLPGDIAHTSYNAAEAIAALSSKQNGQVVLAIRLLDGIGIEVSDSGLRKWRKKKNANASLAP